MKTGTTKTKKGAAAQGTVRTTAGEQGAVQVQTQMVFLMPVHGCEASKVMTQGEAVRERERLCKTVKEHWNHPGVVALVQMLEREAAVLTFRACQPQPAEQQQHAAGQGFAMQQLVAQIQNLRL